ncbi:hypothetical protein [Mycoplasma buteonis]|uniref:hypothetical protein n=1 Tax=Mycoplasma buteonis TaxID=171280 RepID=UPI0005661813|nr:hypothetical protein [Mycoplasma buteonis]
MKSLKDRIENIAENTETKKVEVDGGKKKAIAITLSQKALAKVDYIQKNFYPVMNRSQTIEQIIWEYTKK